MIKTQNAFGPLLGQKLNTPFPGKVSMKVNDNERKYAGNTIGIANMFNRYFASIFTCDSYGSTDHQHRSHNVTRIDNIIGGRNYGCNNEFK